MRSPVADLLADLSHAFAAVGAPWYLFGAQAAIVYGVARLTADVDVTVRPPAEVATASWVQTVEAYGFQQRFADHALVERSRVIPLVHRATGLPVDIVLAAPGLEEELLTRAVTLHIDDVEVPVIEMSDLVALKVLAGRPRDIEDVVTLLRVQRGHIDDRARPTGTAPARGGARPKRSVARTGRGVVASDREPPGLRIPTLR